MRRIVRHISYGVLLLSVLCVLGSCINNGYDDPQTVDDSQAVFVLHITPMSMQAQSSDGVSEKIQTLRVIAISHPEDGSSDSESTIEINRLVTFENALRASELKYALTWTTTPGKKDFYIFANEDKVSDNLKFADNGKVPEDVKSLTSLTELLNHYKATENSEKFELSDKADGNSYETKDNKTEGSDTDSGFLVAEFKNVINAVYFAPQYTIEGEDDGAKEIYLPYSTCYEDVEVKGGKTISKEMFLVPVATKFYFRFYNYHENDVQIQKLTIEKTDAENFLLGQVGDNDRLKEFITINPEDQTETKENCYWVDWLAKVADETHKNLTPDNSEINEKYGWISDYSMPGTSEQQSVQTLIGSDNSATSDFVGGQARKEEETIPKFVGPMDDMPGVLYLGPYYFPESRCLFTYEDENKEMVTVQQYSLGLLMHDTGDNSVESGDFDEKLVIENVKSLFRDTCVLIQITMRKGEVEIYAEIADWVHKEVDGWATGGSFL